MMLVLVPLPVAVPEELERLVEVTRPVVDVAELVVAVLLEGARLYSSRRLPAPQYSIFVSS